MSQSFPDKTPLDGVILDGQLSSTESLWSKDRNTVYTINWFKPHRVYSGDASSNDSIPVLTLGGATDEGLMVVIHSLNFHYGYNYMLSLKSCSDCLDNIPAYLPTRVAADFNRKDYLAAKKIWETKPNLSKKEKDCDPTDGSLLMKFGNVYLNPGPEFITGHIDLKLRTENSYNDLYSLISEIKYDTSVFGDYAVGSESLQVNPTDSVVLSDYALLSQDLQVNKADFSFQRNQQATQSIVISPDYQSVLRLNFTIPASSLENLPEKLKDLFELIDLSGEFMCDGRIYPFDRIRIEDSTIGVQIEGMTSSISYSIAGMEYDDSNPTDLTYTFTVMASSTNLTHLSEASLRFSHNTTAFAANHIDNGLLTIIDTPGTIYTEFIDDFAVSASQLDANSFRILIFDDNPDTPIGELPLLDETPAPLIRLRMRVNDCEQNPEFTFLESEMQGESYFYDPINDFTLLSYIDVMTSEQINTPACGCTGNVNIDSFTPDEIVAGDGQVLTITGTNFGTYQRGDNPGDGVSGTGSSVLFRNGDRPEGTGSEPLYIAAGENDFVINDVISWSDTEIKVKVPSTDWEVGPNGVAATGEIKIRNRCNLEDESSNKLFIPYSLSNFRIQAEEKPFRLGLRKEQDDGRMGYVFEFNANVNIPSGANPNNLNIKEAFSDALSDWCDETQIEFKIEQDDSFTSPAFNDNKNVIAVGSSSTENAEAFVIYSQQYFSIECIEDNGDNEQGLIMTDIDMVIVDDFVYNNPSTTQSRLRIDITHELGHAHLLNHALNTNAVFKPLMHPTGNTNGIKDEDTEGGNRIFQTSQDIVSHSCLQTGSPVNPQAAEQGNCGEIVSISEKEDTHLLNIFPNPTSDVIEISHLHSPKLFEIIDLKGHILWRGKTSIGNFQIDMREFPKGFYTLRIHDNQSTENFKIIKL